MSEQPGASASVEASAVDVSTLEAAGNKYIHTSIDWQLASRFLVPDDESEEGIFDAGGRDVADRYVIIEQRFRHPVETQRRELRREFLRLWAVWTKDERHSFWIAVRKCGKLCPRAISKRVRTKTAEQVSRILFYLDLLKIGVPRIPLNAFKQARSVIFIQYIQPTDESGPKPKTNESENSSAESDDETGLSSRPSATWGDVDSATRFFTTDSLQRLMVSAKSVSPAFRYWLIKALKTWLKRIMMLSAFAAVERSKNSIETSQMAMRSLADASKVDLINRNPEDQPNKKLRVTITFDDVTYAVRTLFGPLEFHRHQTENWEGVVVDADEMDLFADHPDGLSEQAAAESSVRSSVKRPRPDDDEFNDQNDAQKRPVDGQEHEVEEPAAKRAKR